MVNIINLDPSYGVYSITQKNGNDELVINLINATIENSIEIYLGNEYHDTLTLENQSITLPAELFSGSNIHFRISNTDGVSQFFHITYNTEKAFNFKALNYVVISN